MTENDRAQARVIFPTTRLTRLIGWLAAAAIACSTAVMVVISAAGPNPTGCLDRCARPAGRRGGMRFTSRPRS